MTVEASGPYYHGGRANVRVGGLIKPGHKLNSWGDEGGPRARFVYVSTSRETAEAYADAVGRGHVYEVEPTGPIVHDRFGTDFKSEHPFRVVARLR